METNPIDPAAEEVEEVDTVPSELDDTGDFVDMNDAVEVKVDDDDVPMDDDDDENEDEVEAEQAAAANAESIVDMAKSKLEAHTGQIYCVASHFDAATNVLTVLSGGGDDKAFLHKISPGKEPETLPLSYQHTDSVSCAAFNLDYINPDDLKKTPKYAAVGAYDGAIVVYDPDTGNLIKHLGGPSDVEWLAFHPKGGTVLLAGSVEDGTVWMYHVPTSKCMQVFVGHESGVTAGCFSPDGRWALSASSDATLRIWAPKTGLNKHVFRLGDDGAGLTCLATHGGSDQQLLLVGAEDGAAHVCHIGTKKVVATLRHFEAPMEMNTNEEEEEVELPMSVEAVGFAAVNPNWCATGGVDGVLKIWDLTNNGQCRQVCKVAELDGAPSSSSSSSKAGGITRLRWHPTLPLVYTSCSDGAVRIWDARNGTLVRVLTGHSDMINDMDCNFPNASNSSIIVTGGDDNSIRMFEFDAAATLQTGQ